MVLSISRQQKYFFCFRCSFSRCSHVVSLFINEEQKKFGWFLRMDSLSVRSQPLYIGVHFLVSFSSSQTVNVPQKYSHLFNTHTLSFPQPSRGVERVPTPQPTPRASPVPGYVSHHAPATPPLTPPPPPLPPKDRSPGKDVSSESSAPAAALVSAATSMTPQLEETPQAAAVAYESETEVSASLDISEEIRALDGEGSSDVSLCLAVWHYPPLSDETWAAESP